MILYRYQIRKENNLGGNKMTNIKTAFENILNEEYSNDDIAIILENKDKIFTYEESMNCEDSLSEGRNAYDIVESLASSDRAKKSYKEDFYYFKEGKLLDILNEEADSLAIELPAELIKEDAQTVTIEGKDLCNKLGEMYTLISDRYIFKDCITGDQVEELKENKEDLTIEVLDIIDGKEKKLEYKHEEMEIEFNDELDYDRGYSVK